MDKIDRELLEKVAQLHKVPAGAFNIRKNGQTEARQSTKEIEIVPKEDKSGIDIIVKKGVKNKSVHIPVIITMGGFQDLVYNDFYIGDDCDITIIAGCGIDNKTCKDSQHDGIHTFHVGKNSKVSYIERHYAQGKGDGKKILNPVTKVFMKQNSQMSFESLQIGGVSNTIRKTYATLKDGCVLNIKENILTEQRQQAKTYFKVNLMGKNCKCDVVSHSVAKGESVQEFVADVVGQNECFAHVECDGILLDNARIVSTPKIDAKHSQASLVHEAAIGKIAGDQLVKLMSLGLDQNQAEQVIIKGFLEN